MSIKQKVLHYVTAFAFLFLTSLAHSQEDAQTVEQEATELTEQEQYDAWRDQVLASLTPITGDITLEAANAEMHVPENFYFLNAKDAKTVLEDVWGNPPGDSVLGMLFPAGLTPFDAESWAVTIEYEEDGYVSDEDADDINYDDLLATMKEDVAADSEARVEQGYEAIELIGWASAPYYDAKAKKLHWAKEIKFGSSELNTLNYNIRVLGRKGVLVMNFIAGMDQKALIDSNIDTVLAMAEFEPGSKYADFDPDIDKVAAYGLGALVAGKVIAKTGLFAMALIFLKKFGVFILLGLGALVKKIGFGKKKDQAEQS